MPDIPEVVKKFIGKYIQSVDALEILLLLQNTPQKEWRALEVSATLQLDPTAIDGRLHELKSAGLIRDRYLNHQCLYRYGPSTAEMALAMEELAKTYSTYRVGIIEMIFSQPLKKIQTFADAFLLRKDEEDESSSE